MRLDKVWTVARKDISEFRTNKYIMFSLILMPILMAVVLPIIYLSPFTLFSTSQSGSLDLNLNLDQPALSDQTIENQTVFNASLNNITLINSVARGCLLDHCTVKGSVIGGSFIGNSSVQDSVIIGSNLLNSPRSGGASVNSFVLDQQTEDQQFLNYFISFLMLFFILIPGIIPTVIASYSYVGEKLNKSLEPLLATPTTDLELLSGKALSIFLPSMIATWLAFIPFVIIVDVMTSSVLGYLPLPNATWILGIFLLAPLICLLSIFLNVIVSARVVDVRASQQIGSLVILPVVVFFVVALISATTVGVFSMLLFSALVFGLDLVVLYITLRTFRREEILIKWK